MTDPTSSGFPTGPVPPPTGSAAPRPQVSASPPPTGSSATVSQLGRYRIQRKLGVGGSATVFLAMDTTIDKPVALKVLHEHLRDDPVTVRRFANDARALAKLNHSNIVQIYAAELDQYYFAMEHVEGVDLAKLIADGGAIATPRAMHIALQLGDALAHIHRQGLLHRDVKPGNVLVAPGDRVKMTDFSIAREAEETMLTLKGSLVGTVEYMAPEQIREEPSDVRADIYALGAVLYEMLAGRPPLARDPGVPDLWPLMERILKETPRPLREIDPSIPAAISDAVVRALEKDPALRFASVDEFLAAIRSSSESAQTVMAVPVALARPVESDGAVRLSWTPSDAAEFDSYELHSSADRNFTPSAQTLAGKITDRSQTEFSLASPPSAGALYFRVRTVLRGGLSSLSNRASVDIGYRPPFWRRRWFAGAAAGAALIVLAAGAALFVQRRGVASSVTAASVETARIRGLFSGATYYPQSGRYRLTLARPVFESLDAGAIADSVRNQKLARITIDVSKKVAESLDADGIDLTLLPNQNITLRGRLTEQERQGVILTPESRSDFTFETPKPAIREIAAGDWTNYQDEVVRIDSVVRDVQLFSNSQSVLLILDGEVRVFMYSAVKSAIESRGVVMNDLRQKRVTVTGPVRNVEKFGYEIVLGRPEHLIVR